MLEHHLRRQAAGVLATLVGACGGEALETTEDGLGNCVFGISGRIDVAEDDTEGTLKNRPLKGIDVRVSGSLINNGGMIIWGKTETDANGFFHFAESKTCSDRRLRVEVRFHGSGLEVNEPGKIDWMNVFENGSKQDPGYQWIGTRRFSSSATHGELKDSRNIKRATTYYVVRTIMDRLKSEHSWLGFDRKINVRYPAATPGGVSWADGTSMTAYIQGTGGNDQWDIDTVIHEVMHLWNYQHNSGTTNWVDAILDGSTHSFQEEPVIAFHEGFAEFAKDELMHEIWGRGKSRPRTRYRLDQYGLDSLAKLEQNDDGVRWGLYLLTSENVYRYVFGTASSAKYGTEVDTVLQPAGCPAAPNITLWQLLMVFKANPGAGWDKDWEVGNKDYGLFRFFRRARDILPNFTDADRLLYVDLLDTTLAREPQSRCSSSLSGG